MLAPYLPIVLLFALAFAFAFFSVAIAPFTGPLPPGGADRPRAAPPSSDGADHGNEAQRVDQEQHAGADRGKQGAADRGPTARLRFWLTRRARSPGAASGGTSSG